MNAWCKGLIGSVLLSMAVLLATGCPDAKGPDFDALKDLGKGDPGKEAEYFFCFWNVENLFDDKEDGLRPPDDSFDKYFSSDSDALAAKLEKLTSVLMKMNGGKGPDILSLAEVESERAATLLMEAMNQKLADKSLHYHTVVYVAPGGARTIAVPLITRLRVEGKGRLLGNRLRIQENRVVVNGHPLVIINSHWSSRISDTDGKTRSRYADQIYGRYRAMHKSNPEVDFLVCGDFNDNPDDPSVTDHLHASDDLDAVKNASDPPKLFACLAQAYKDGKGTLYFRNKPFVFDHICVSPGLLDDKGWTCLIETAAIVPEMASPGGAPNRFGGASDKRPYSRRGASDHFPVVVKLRVAAKEE